MSELLNKVDLHTRLAGFNKLEILLFSLGKDQGTGREETFGINVFKVREVMRTPDITHAPDMPTAVEGVVGLRGKLVPVIDLVKYAGIHTDQPSQTMIVTEYNGHTQGFLVQSVDTILRVDWSSMKVPPEMLTAQIGGHVTAVTEIKDGRIVMMLDVEKILADTTSYTEDIAIAALAPLDIGDKTVFFADDSLVARKQIIHTLEALGLKYISTTNGKEAWQELQKTATHAAALHQTAKDHIQLILVDVEMPEMDGYVLTRNIKSDPRFSGIPVLMHSSLSSHANVSLGNSVGVDEYVPKFTPDRLAEALSRMLGEATDKASIAHDRHEDADLLAPIAEQTTLAGSHKMELLLFSLGSDEIFGINVFKIREITNTPHITRTPNVPPGVEGFISLRGNIVPVISLSGFINNRSNASYSNQTLVVTEFSRRIQGILVHDVDRIIRVDWDKIKPPQNMLVENESIIAAITELADGRLVSILDVEQLLDAVVGAELVPALLPVAHHDNQFVFFADDSAVARRNITGVLDRMGISYQQANNGAEAWEKLKTLAAQAQQDNRPLYESLRLILTDAEMPEMDGYVLTKNIKADHRFNGIPVVMHSSLSSDTNKKMGKQAGVDTYIEKFDPVALSETIRPLLV